jgi:hypothetical protein
VAAHGGRLIGGYSGCPVIPGNTPVFDGVLLRLRVRVPTNANTISFNFAFLTSQFPDVCTAYNDHFLALLTTNAAGVPADRNIIFDSLNRPMTVETVWYQICKAVTYQPCPLGAGRLAGTGFDTVGGGATDWLTSQALVVPGEIITLEFYLFDVGDHGWDTTVLLDNLQWLFIPQAPTTAVDGAVPDAPLAFALDPVRPNPSRGGALTVRFSLPTDAPARLELLDVAGRRIASHDVGAGQHTIDFGAGQRLEPGLYLVRLTQGANTRTTRVAVLH